MANATTRHPTISAEPPRSVSNNWTVSATLVGAAFGCAITLWWYPEGDSRLSALLLMACVFIPVSLVELFVNEAPENSGLEFKRRKPSYGRIARKITALWAIFALLAIAYGSFPVYAGKNYESFQWLLSNFGWLLVIVSVPYIAVVDTFQTDPEDGLASWGRLLSSLSFKPTVSDINYLLGWVVKGFFLPLMFGFLVGNLENLRSASFSNYTFLPNYLYDVTYNALYFVDVVVGAVGYAATLRLLGTEIRSTEPTLMGWMVAVVCYPPFWDAVGGSYLSYGHARPWGALLRDHPILYTIWGTAIVFALFLYAWSTIVFGIRFSNLTHRGIITSGPYRWTKHPAYISKNISWWLIGIPFLPPDGSVLTALKLCLMLAFVNLIYYLRALTEERHLSQDPVYREYSEYISRHGLFSFLRK
jgi:protein-S-isoprenylcysteine O-methyltransferase Ste14